MTRSRVLLDPGGISDAGSPDIHVNDASVASLRLMPSCRSCSLIVSRPACTAKTSCTRTYGLVRTAPASSMRAATASCPALSAVHSFLTARAARRPRFLTRPRLLTARPCRRHSAAPANLLSSRDSSDSGSSCPLRPDLCSLRTGAVANRGIEPAQTGMSRCSESADSEHPGLHGHCVRVLDVEECFADCCSRRHRLGDGSRTHGPALSLTNFSRYAVGVGRSRQHLVHKLMLSADGLAPERRRRSRSGTRGSSSGRVWRPRCWSAAARVAR